MGRRRRRGLGDLLTDRIRLKMDEHPTLGPKVMKRIRHEATKELCSEGHDSYCGGERARRAADLEAAFAEGALAERSVSAATRAGCSAPKGRVCVQKDVAKLRSGRMRRGCSYRPKSRSYVCTPKALKAFEAGEEHGKPRKKKAKKAVKRVKRAASKTRRSATKTRARKGARSKKTLKSFCVITRTGKTFNCFTSKKSAQNVARGKKGWKVKRKKR